MTETIRPIDPHTAEILGTQYIEVCKSHTGIAHFRAQLLAFLPLASGAGIGLLLINDVKLADQALPLILAGIFGAVVTWGLFLYELRQIDVCRQLRNHATWIENQLGIPAGQFGGAREDPSLRQAYTRKGRCERDRRFGFYEKHGIRDGVQGLVLPKGANSRVNSGKSSPHGAPRPKLADRPFVGAAEAGFVVYHTAILGWLAVAGFGIAGLVSAICT